MCVCVYHSTISVNPESDMMGLLLVTQAGIHTHTLSRRKVSDKSHCLASQPVCISLPKEEQGKENYFVIRYIKNDNLSGTSMSKFSLGT